MFQAVPVALVQDNPPIQFGQDQQNQYDKTFIALREVDGSSAAAFQAVLDALPIGSVVEHIYMRNVGASAIVTGTAVGFGTSADPDKYAEATHQAGDGAEYWLSADANNPLSAAADFRITPTNGSGTAAGTLAGTYQLKITGRVCSKIAPA